MFNNGQRKGLKAWVRYDGNKNAVAGSLIFQKDKPKVGNWKEYMDVNLCCPSTPSSCNTSNLNIELLLSGLNVCYEQVTTLIPNIVYFSDYGDGYTTAISDGCSDMYDAGNSFNTNLTQTYYVAGQDDLDFELSIPYTHTQDNGDADECDYTNPPMDGQIVSGTGYFNTATCSKYFTNMYPGLFVLAATGVNVQQFGIYGDLGSDGQSVNQAYQQLSDYPGWGVFLKTNNDNDGTGDPNVTHIILVYGDLNYVAHAYDSTGRYDDDALVGLGSNNTAIISLTLATESGEDVIDISTATDIANQVLGLATFGCTTTTTTTTMAPGNVDIASSTDFNISGDFTIEFFMNMANTDGFPRVYSFGAYPAPNAISIEGGGSSIYFWANNTPLLVGAPGDVGIDLVGNWCHVAIVGNGGFAHMYLNGYELTNAAYGGPIPSGGLPLTIGFGNESNSYFNGYLSNFRWTDSAVYTAPFNGSVPTAPLTDLAATKLLIFQGDTLPLELTDNSGNGHNASNSGANYSALNPFVGVDGSLQVGSV